MADTDALPVRRRVVIAFGSNVDPERHLPLALEALAGRERVCSVSRVWETEPVGAPGTPRFLNAAALIETTRPLAWLRADLRRIEADLGRVRAPDPNAPRTIDLDIVVAEGTSGELDGGRLRLPDPELVKRPHVGYPAGEAAPGLRHPTDGRTLAEIAAALGPPGRSRRLRGWRLPAAG